MIYLLVGLGGVIGSTIRYLFSVFALSLWTGHFPLGTLVINLTGSFLLGWMTNRLLHSSKFHPSILTAFSTGVIGSYTTYSTFAVETVRLFDTGAYYTMVFYVSFSLIGGLLFAKWGLTLGAKQAQSAEGER